mmetsp:Transcript_16535/g.36023  ORF Transcript_16535/g.36023 Transcript_16535/m.36023 type:complete len:457 (-) Transcript_16535:477-1847(-)
MDFGYLVCSTLRCDPEPFSSHSIDGNCDDSIAQTKNDESSSPPSPHPSTSSVATVEPSYSGFSSISEHQQSSSAVISRSSLSLSSLDASSDSILPKAQQRKRLQSPSSLALQRRPPAPSFSLKQQTLSTDISSTSGDNSTGLDSNSNSNGMGIKSNSNISEPGASGLENGMNNIFVSNTEMVDAETNNVHTPKKRTLVDHPGPEFQQFCLDPPSLRSKGWSEPSAEDYCVRSKAYLKNKIKEPSEKSVFRLITVDLVNSKTPIYTGMCAHPGERVQKALERERKTGVRELPEFVFAVNLCIPAGTIYHAVFYYGIDKTTMDEIKQGQTPFGRIMNKFIFGDSDSYRNNTFKLIPRIIEGNYVVRKGVGSKPVILGKKIKQNYVTDDRYFEIIVDIASDAVAKRITKLCLGYIKTIVVDMMFVLEGKDETALPERIFGGATIKNLDFKTMDGKRTVR